MPYILGLDPSLAKAGFVVLHTDKPITHIVERGLLKTKTGVLVQRLIEQAKALEQLIEKYDIKFLASEAPYWGGNEAEILYSVHMYFHKVYLEHNCFVLTIPPQSLKKNTIPDKSVEEVSKAHMVDRAKNILGLHGHRLSNDEADAYHVAVMGYRFYKWHFEKTLSENNLTPYEKDFFAGKHTYKRGLRRGTTKYFGAIYRPNELYFDYEKINELAKEKQ